MVKRIHSFPSMGIPGSSRKGATTRTRILGAAREVLVEKGLDGLVMREIAGNCDMQLGNLQYYFGNRDELLIAIITAEAEKDIETIHRMLALDLESRTKLRRIVIELVTRWRNESAVVLATMTLLALQKPVYRKLYDRVYANFYDALESLIAIARPGLSREEYRLRTRLMSALIDGAIFQTKMRNRTKFLDAVVDEVCAIAFSKDAISERKR